jgi:hypothetical protein
VVDVSYYENYFISLHKKEYEKCPRLDLPRVSILTDPERMATKEGAEKARLGLK